MLRRRGGLIGDIVTPSLASAPGIWSMADVADARKANIWPVDNRLELDFLAMSALVKDSGTPANYFDGDPNSLLTYTSPSTKYVMNDSGVLVPGTTLRTDHNAGGTALGLLVEPQATNLVTRSETFDHADWGGFRTSVTANAALAPDGNSSADRVVDDGTSGDHFIGLDFTLSGSTTYTISVFAKADAHSWFQLTGGSAAWGTSIWANFDLANGVVGNAGAGGTYSIEDVGGGWFRCSFTGATDGDGGTAFSFVIALTNNIDAATKLPSYSGAGGGIFVWGAQAEIGSAPSSYIKTEGSQVTRAADDITIPQADFPWNGGSGTLTINGSPYTPETDGTDFDIAATALNNSIGHVETLTWVPA